MKVAILRQAVPAMISALAVLADDDVGDALATRLAEMMGADGTADDVLGPGCGESNPDAFAGQAIPEKRPVDDAEPGITLDDLTAIYRAARAYW